MTAVGYTAGGLVTTDDVGEIGGPAGPLDEDGLIPEAQLPAGAGDSPDPASTVTAQTTAGASSTPGAAATYSRGDHAHGTPALPTPAAIGASATGHNHTGTYDPAGTASSAVTTHSGATTSVHGIANTAALETTTGSAAKVTAHAGASDPHGDRAYADSAVNGRVPTARQVLAGTGLAGGGDLSADRTLTVAYGSSSTTAARGDDSRLSNARTPTAHASSHATAAADPIAPTAIGATPLPTYSTPLTGAAWTNATTALGDVTGLALSIPAAGTFEFDFWVVWSGSVGTGTSTATAPRWQLNGPASSHLEFTVEIQTANATNNMFRRNAMATPASPTTGAQTADNPYMTRLRGRIVATASGTLQPQASLATGTATGIVSVLNGSYGRLQQAA